MLVGKNRNRGEEGHLLATLHRLECCAHGDLCLPEADVSTDETIHGVGGLHVMFDVLDSFDLPRRLCVRECIIKLPLYFTIFRILMPLRLRALGVDRKELASDALRFLRHFLRHLLPLLRSKACEHRLVALFVDELTELVSLIDRNE